MRSLTDKCVIGGLAALGISLCGMGSGLALAHYTVSGTAIASDTWNMTEAQSGPQQYVDAQDEAGKFRLVHAEDQPFSPVAEPAQPQAQAVADWSGPQ